MKWINNKNETINKTRYEVWYDDDDDAINEHISINSTRHVMCDHIWSQHIYVFMRMGQKSSYFKEDVSL